MKFSHAVCFLMIAGCASPPNAVSQAPVQWRSFRLNPELNPVIDPDGKMAVSWAFKTGAGISSSPTVSNDTLYVTSNDHRLYALDIRTGRIRWTFKAENELMAAPLVVDDAIIIGEGNNYSTNYDPPNYGLLADGANGIIAVDAHTGKERWHYRLPGSAMPTSAVVDGAIEEHDAAGMLFALDAKTGKYKWRRYLGSVAAMSAANNFRGSEVVTAGDYPNSVIDYDGTDGHTIWRTEFPNDASAFADCPNASDGSSIYGMYFARPHGSPYTFVGYTTPGIERAYAIDANSGRIEWDVPLASGILAINNHASIPMISGGSMYVGSPVEPALFALDADSGNIRWKLKTHGTVQGGLVEVDGTVYFGDRGGYLWAVDANTGAVVGTRKMRDKFNVGSPIVVGKTLIIGSGHGYVFAVPLASISAGASPTIP